MLFIHTFISFLKDKDYRELVIGTLVIILIGAVAYHYIEGWSWLDSIYFSLVTITTLGFGDITPVTTAGKIFTIFYIIVGVGLILTFINCMYSHYNTIRIIKKEEYENKNAMTKGD